MKGGGGINRLIKSCVVIFDGCVNNYYKGGKGMKRFYKMMVFVVAFLSVASMGFANTYNDHVYVSANGKGDVLVYPFYIAAQGWQTQFDVVNTSGHSVVAKLVVHSAANSVELLDFLIYLSPYDMWRGTLKIDPTYGSQPIMYSTDSSAPSSNSSVSYFATATNPMAQPLSTSFCSGDSNQAGYVEVIEAWAGDPVFASKTDKEARGLAIKSAYDQATVFSTIDTLSGSMVINYAQGGILAARDAVAMANYRNIAYLKTGELTYLGEKSRNNVQEVDSALAKTALELPFDNNSTASSLQIVTFPTKQTQNVVGDCKTFAYKSAYFTTGNAVYNTTQYDNEEQTSAASPFSPASLSSKMPSEVNFLPISAAFSFGWLKYAFDTVSNTGFIYNNNTGGQPLGYTGAPLIPTVVKIINGVMTFTNGAWDDGVITGTMGGVAGNPSVTLSNYQYTSAFASSVQP